MARQRRGGGFKPPELRGTLGTLLRTAAAQVGPLRDALGDALERTAREGRSRLDDARSRFEEGRSSRRRSDALADLGEIVLDLIRRGEIDLAELPEVRDIVAHLDELDAETAYSHEEENDQTPPPPPARNRFDSRARDSRTPSPRRKPADSDDDGTTSSRSWTPPRSAKPAPRVWRPPVDVVEEPPPPPDSAKAPARSRPIPRRGTGKGGISFDDDDNDLADYMHPDDVPPKKPGDDED